MSHVDNRPDTAWGNKKIIAFDMDGVIINNNPLKLEVAQKLGYKLKITETASEIIRKILSPEDLKKLQTSLYHNLGVSMNAGLMPGIVELLSSIKKNGNTYYLISRRGAPEVAIEYLKAKGLWPHYFNESNAFFVVEPIEKNITARRLGVTHFVDDETKILAVLADVPNKFLFDYMNVFPEGDYIKVASHEELSKHLL